MSNPPVEVSIIMGSQSDWQTMRHAAEMLKLLAIECEILIISAHRTPERLYHFSKTAQERGIKVIIAGAGGAAHLPGMVASMTVLPVFGVPVESKALSGLDSLLSIVQMPGGIPVGTVAIGEAGAKNAALLAASVIALSNPKVMQSLQQFRQQQTDAVPEMPAECCN
jgi:5-(carboxyamino)imidazole ribonucleotide mutase